MSLTVLEKEKTYLENCLLKCFLKKINNMELDDQFLISTFLRENKVSLTSDAEKVFNSSYKRTIMDTVEQELLLLGYNCSITFDDKRIMYKTRIMNFKRMFLFFFLFVSLFASVVFKDNLMKLQQTLANKSIVYFKRYQKVYESKVTEIADQFQPWYHENKDHGNVIIL
jgi:hypothetical protein